MYCKTVHFSRHAVERMFERGITPKDVRTVVANGETIENYPDDKPHPSCLMLGFVGAIPVHVVVACDSSANCQIVTVYVPDTRTWQEDLKTRRIK